MLLATRSLPREHRTPKPQPVPIVFSPCWRFLKFNAKREVSSKLLENLEPGDYVMVHAGVAIAKITDEDESETDQLMEELL